MIIKRIVLFSISFLLSSKICFSASHFALKTNSSNTFDAPISKTYEIGLIEGIASSDKIKIKRPIQKISIFNNSGSNIRIDGILLNETGFLFNKTAFDFKYGKSDTISENKIKKIFWNNYRIIHHANSPPNLVDNNLYTIWNSLGFGICTNLNKAFMLYLQDLGVENQAVPVKFHQLYQYKINDLWQVYDFDQKAYYLTTKGSVASFNDIFSDPYLVFNQPTYSPLSEHFKRYNIAVLLSNKIPDSLIILNKISKWETFFKEHHKKGIPVDLHSGDTLIFNDENVSGFISEYTESLWENASYFLKRGYIELKPENIIAKKTTIKRNFPFLIDKIRVKIPYTQGDGTVIILLNGTPILSRDIDQKQPSLDFSRSLETPIINPNLEVNIVSGQRQLEIEDFVVEYSFLYNDRAIQNIKPVNNLNILSDTSKELAVTIDYKEDYNNPYFEKKNTVTFLKEEKKYSFKADPLTDKSHGYYEYFISSAGVDYPFSPAFYYLSKNSDNSLDTTLLPAGKYDFHIRSLNNQYLSLWQHYSEVISIPSNTNEPHLIFRNENEKILAILEGNKNETYTLYISELKQFPIKEGMPFFNQTKTPLSDGLTKEPTHKFKKITIKSGQEIEFPEWGCYYRITDDKMYISPLYQPSVKLKIVPKKLTLELEDFSWPLEKYRWDLE